MWQCPRGGGCPGRNVLQSTNQIGVNVTLSAMNEFVLRLVSVTNTLVDVAISRVAVSAAVVCVKIIIVIIICSAAFNAPCVGREKLIAGQHVNGW